METTTTTSVFAFKGTATVMPNGAEEVCVTDVIDETVTTALQIEGAGDQGFVTRDSIKLVGNIPLRKVGKDEIVSELERRHLRLCSNASR